MKKIILSLFINLFLLFLFTSQVSALAKTTVEVKDVKEASPAVQKLDYFLPYPGILPDHPLYRLKMLRDKIMGFLITDPVKKTEFYILMADKRLGAGKALIEGAKTTLGEETISKGENYLEQAVSSVVLAQQKGKSVADVLEKLEKSTRKHIEVLEEVLDKAPEQARPGLKNALENAQKGYQRVLELKGSK